MNYQRSFDWLIQAHRGAGAQRPENTLESCQYTWSHSPRLIPELDVSTTNDGVIVAFHDKDLARVGGGGPINAWAWACGHVWTEAIDPAPRLCYNAVMASVSTSVDIFRRVIDPDHGSLSQDFARYIQSWNFPPEDHARYEELSAKARDGTLTADERNLLDAYLQADGLISLLKMKADRSLRA